MTGWVILVDQPKDLPNAETPHKVITTSEYLARPKLFDIGRPSGGILAPISGSLIVAQTVASVGP